jgi:phosphatidylserine decarboxylase
VQPGGHGFFVRCELAWGRLRRSLLRRLRPGYVTRMHALRQGHCPDCPHDIIDPRDLKYCRTVCGIWFRPEDDRFRTRDRLGFARYGFPELVGFSVILLALIGLAAWGAVALTPFLWALVAALGLVELEILWFFRDPPRKVPTDADALVSPADGTVSHVEEVEEPDFPGGRALRVSIFLSIFNVHVNRVPRSARVLAVRYQRGAFLDARHPECATRNERLWVDFEEPNGRRLRVKQISGAIARRIVCWLKPGDEVRAGDRFGMIKFGSRTDVLVPAGDARSVLVKVGDKVKGGRTVLMRL